MTINQLLKSALTCPHTSPRFAFIAPYLKQAKDIAWDYVHRFAGVIPGASFNESELRVDLPGDRRLRLYGADNPDSIQGIYLDGVVMDEYQLTDPRLFTQVVRPMLADRRGWVIFAGKPWGRNHFYDLFRKMQGDPSRLVRLYRASETGYIAEDELREMRVGPPPMTEDSYQQELECSWEAAIEGAYYARQMEQVRAEGRIRVVPWEPSIPVETFWDLGVRDDTVIIFAQRSGREIHVIDYLETNGQELAYYATELQRRPYLYGDVVLPHDGGKRELGPGKTIAVQLGELMPKASIRVLPQGDVEPGIEAARRLFARTWFDGGKCDRLVEALAQYRRAYDVKGQTLRPKPLHDWTSHGADAFRYMAVALEDEPVERTPRKPLVYKAVLGALR